MIPLLGPIISAVSTLGGSYLERKKIEATEKVKIARARVEGEIDWDIAQARASESSWKDEYLCLLISIPLILCWIPGCEEFIKRGFNTLEQMPTWYQALLMIVFSASFGYRGLMKFLGKK